MLEVRYTVMLLDGTKKKFSFSSSKSRFEPSDVFHKAWKDHLWYLIHEGVALEFDGNVSVYYKRPIFRVIEGVVVRTDTKYDLITTITKKDADKALAERYRELSRVDIR